MTNLNTKKSLINKENKNLSVVRQCELVGIARSSYYAPVSKSGFSEEEERAMQIIDKTHTEHSYYGSRSHTKNLARCGINFGRHHVARLMKHMGIRSTAPQPNTSKPAKYHPKIPYLLRGKTIRFPNQVWASDITYIPLGRGHVYLSAIIDWYSRFIVGWRLHDTLEAHESIICMEDTIERRGVPAISNSDQGSTYTAQAYIDCLNKHGIRQSMDGARRWADNVIIERWFRDLKHYCIYQTEYKNMRELKRVISEHIHKYNYDKLHSSLDYSTPAEWYFSGINKANAPEMMQKKKAA